MRRGNHYKKSLWTEEEDKILVDYIRVHGKGHWNSIAKKTGLKRCGKSCRLRWMNYLSPSVKLGEFTKEEEDLIIRLHKLLGNRWSLIAGRVPGRTDNQVKNYWNTHLYKKVVMKKKENSKVDHVSTTANSRSIEVSEPQRTSKLNLFSGSSSVNEATPIAVDVSDMKESMIGTECYYANSFWVSYNESELTSPDFMELLDGFL